MSGLITFIMTQLTTALLDLAELVRMAKEIFSGINPHKLMGSSVIWGTLYYTDTDKTLF